MWRILTAVVIGMALSSGPAWAEYSKSQELTILSVRSAYLAAQNCPFVLDTKATQAVLSRKHLTQPEIFSGRFSALLQDDLAVDTARYQSETSAACNQAWASFGPDGPMKGLLRAK